MPLRIGLGRKRDDEDVDELLGARLLLLAGRSPDEQFAMLQRLGCLSPRGQGERMAVILLLSRLYEAHVARGYQPPDPLVAPEPSLAEIWKQATSAPPIGTPSDQLQLSRIQCDALVKAGFLDRTVCRVEASGLEAWWAAALPSVVEIHEEHDRVFAAIAPRGNPKPGQRTDPITCPLCGRPAPRGATYCVWCGCWLAARPR
jgi:hypothetical protein